MRQSPCSSEDSVQLNKWIKILKRYRRLWLCSRERLPNRTIEAQTIMRKSTSTFDCIKIMVLFKPQKVEFGKDTCSIQANKRLLWNVLSNSCRNWNSQCDSIWNLIVFRLGLEAEKAMAPHSSTLALKIPWMEESGRLQYMGWLRIGHNWTTSLSLFTFMHWRRKWQPTPVFLPGESQGRASLVGFRLWGCTESDTTEAA